MRVPENKFYNEDFKEILNSYLGKRIEKSKFSELNFYYIYNMPEIKLEKGTLKIRINEEIDNFKWDIKFLDDIIKRRKSLVDKLKRNGYFCVVDDFQVEWRLIVGLGGIHPQETNMTLHHVYGIPYIPGSAIKGVTRQCVVLKYAEKSEVGEEDFENKIREISKGIEEAEEKYEDLANIFGSKKRVGKVIFFDAYPVKEVKLKLDIMNVHYPGYYTGNEPPGDWQSPNPIKFLTVEKTVFNFLIAGREQSLVEKAFDYLKMALSEHGIGAKTRLGYGYFLKKNHY